MDIALLKEKCLALFDGEEGLSAGELQEIERRLSITLPAEFREIAQFCNGGFYGGTELNEFSLESPQNIVTETLRLREAVRLHECYVFLAELSESAIFMNCGNGRQRGMVLWCDSADIEAFETDEIKDLSGFVEVWSGFAEFFESLLEQAEE